MRWKGEKAQTTSFLILKQFVQLRSDFVVWVKLKFMPFKKFQFRGLMAPVFTPFNASGEIDLNVIPPYAQYLLDNNIQGVLINGTTGEGTSLTVNERSNVLSKWIEMKRLCPQFNVMVQVGGTNLTDVQILAKNAESQGADAILCLPDLFFKPSNVNDLILYLQTVSAAAPCTPLLYYHIPAYTGVNLNMKELMEASKEIPSFVGIKFTDDDLKIGSSCASQRLKDSTVFLGCDHLFLNALQLGFDSAISTTINLFPGLHTNILQLHQQRNFDAAHLEQEKLNRNISKITEHGSWVSSMKAAMNKITNINVGPVRRPLKNVDLNCMYLNFEKPIDLKKNVPPK